MSIEALKQQARRHEQKEEWEKALDQYQKAIKALTQDDQTDIGLLNRVGDLFVRVGRLNDAIEHYEQAVDLYREAFLPNNAIAVCKKIIRNVPDRHQAYLKIGQIRAEQGFLPDARTNFLTYAERMQQSGDLDESFRALVEFCDLAPDDVGVRITVADQMAASERTEEAVEQLVLAYSRLTQSGETERAGEVEQKIQELDPSVDVGAAAAGLGGVGDDLGGFGDIDLGGPSHDSAQPGPEAELAGMGDFEITGSDESLEVSDALVEAAEDFVADFGEQAGEDEEEEVELPMIGLDDEAEEEEEVELPMIGLDDEEEAPELPVMDFDEVEPEDAGAELPTMGFDSEADEAGAVELPIMSFDDESVGLGAAEQAGMEGSGPVEGFATAAEDFEGSGGLTEMASEAVEEAVEEAAPDLEPLVESGPAAAESVEAAVAPEAAPAEESGPPSGGYVDLGAMVLGGGAAEEKSTRFKVAYQEPTGDEAADFAKMLSQFKEKVSENLDSADVRAHYDLGTAYKEMGLLEEAISSFQQALRASSDHLPTYEQMGQTFLEMGQPEAAVRTLERALKSKPSVEDEFVGIYYHLARAFEALDNKDSAVEYYDRVFALDINFADVTERLRELR